MRMIILAAAARARADVCAGRGSCRGPLVPSRHRRLHQLRLPDAGPMRGKCYRNRRILRAERELFGIRRCPRASSASISGTPAVGSARHEEEIFAAWQRAGRRSPYPFAIAVVGCAMYQTAAAMSAMIATHKMISITNRCTASRDCLPFVHVRFPNRRLCRGLYRNLRVAAPTSAIPRCRRGARAGPRARARAAQRARPRACFPLVAPDRPAPAWARARR